MCVTHLSDSTSMFLSVSDAPDNAAIDAESRACAPPHSGWGALVQIAHGKKKGIFLQRLGFMLKMPTSFPFCSTICVSIFT